jgi:hypothetical protein
MADLNSTIVRGKLKVTDTLDTSGEIVAEKLSITPVSEAGS